MKINTWGVKMPYKQRCRSLVTRSVENSMVSNNKCCQDLTERIFIGNHNMGGTKYHLFRAASTFSFRFSKGGCCHPCQVQQGWLAVFFHLAIIAGGCYRYVEPLVSWVHFSLNVCLWSLFIEKRDHTGSTIQTCKIKFKWSVKTKFRRPPTERRPAWCCGLARACRRASACKRTRPPPGSRSAARCTSQHTWGWWRCWWQSGQMVAWEILVWEETVRILQLSVGHLTSWEPDEDGVRRGDLFGFWTSGNF